MTMTEVAGSQSKASPKVSARAPTSPIYKLPATAISNHRRDTTTAGASSTRTNLRQQELIGNDDANIQRRAAWYYDPDTGRITDTSRDDVSDDLHDDDGTTTTTTSHTQAEDVLTSDEPIVRYQDDAPYYPILYSCELALQQNTDDRGGNGDADSMLNEVTIPMTVEALLPSTIRHIGEDVQALQWSILNVVGRRSGIINDCNLELQHQNDEGHLLRHHRRRLSRRDISRNNVSQRRPSRLNRNLEVSNLSYPTTVYKITSDRTTNWKADCTGSENGFDSSTFQCHSIQLFIAVKYWGSISESNQVEEFVRSIVRNQIQVDPKELFVLNISGLYWLEEDPGDIFRIDGPVVPENSTVVDGPAANDTAAGSPQVDLNDGTVRDGIAPAEIIIPTITFVFLVALWLGVHWRYRWRKRKEEAFETKLTHKAGSHPNDDVESGSVRTEPLSIVSPTNSSSNPVDLDEISLEDGVAELELAAPPTETSNGMTTVAGLPPRPHGLPRTASLKLKKRRKKKKVVKKKVAALKRVNSRENVTVLPTLSESEDEGSELGSAEGESEHASDDDGSSYDGSSGHLTPTRTRTCTSSGGASTSPRVFRHGESFPSDFLSSDIEFVIEASAFPNLFDQEEKGDNTTTSPSSPPRRQFEDHQGEDIWRERATSFEKQTFEIEPASVAGLNDSSCASIEGGLTVMSMLPLPWLGKK